MRWLEMAVSVIVDFGPIFVTLVLEAYASKLLWTGQHTSRGRDSGSLQIQADIEGQPDLNVYVGEVGISTTGSKGW